MAEKANLTPAKFSGSPSFCGAATGVQSLPIAHFITGKAVLSRMLARQFFPVCWQGTYAG